MLRDEIRPSSEIDAHCTRCKMLTNHRVIALQEGVIKRVICLTCQSQHNYHAPPGQKKPVIDKTKRIQKEKKRVRGPAENQTFQQWMDLKAALTAEPRPYTTGGAFEKGQAIDHAKFGLGFILKITGRQRIEVMFEKEIKTLVMNYP